MTQADRFSEDEVSAGFPEHSLESSWGRAQPAQALLSSPLPGRWPFFFRR